MMFPTTRSLLSSSTAPIITFLSSSPAASQRAVDRLCEWTSLSASMPQPLQQDATETKFHHVISWSLTTTQCQETGITVQWLAPTSSSTSSDASPRHSLLAIQAGGGLGLSSSNSEDNDPLAKNTKMHALFKAFDSNGTATTLTRTKLKLCDWFRRPISSSYLLGPSCQPLLQLDFDHHEDDDADSSLRDAPPLSRAGLKELVIPMDDHDDGAYDDSDDVTSQSSSSWTRLSVSSLSSSSSSSSLLTRPATGLYLLQGCLCLRPLPTGKHDRQLPPPSLIFHSTSNGQSNPNDDPKLPPSSRRGSNSSSLGQEKEGGNCNSNDVILRKIGHSGVGGGGGGQYRLDCADFAGLDVRLCSSTNFTSMFAEAQESLLAGSLEKLQSSRVLGQRRSASTASKRGEEKDAAVADDDPRFTNADCWMEFRATLRSPLGYLHGNKKGTKTVKIPDLPYE